MGKAHITVFCGGGKGKTSAALGQGIFGASAGKSVIIIQFLKGKVGERIDFIKRLEPEIKVFCFEKSDMNFEALSPEEQKEEAMFNLIIQKLRKLRIIDLSIVKKRCYNCYCCSLKNSHFSFSSLLIKRVKNEAYL